MFHPEYFIIRRPRVTSKFLSAWGLIALSIILSACNNVIGPRFPPAPTQVEAFDYFYLIGPGDTVSIQVWRNPELSMGVTVRPDGKITSPLIEDIQASGRTPTALAREMEQHLSKYVQSPVVTVIVSGFSGPFTQQIRIIGEAVRPQALPYREFMTLLDVMIIVGGITDFAAGNRATILRTIGGKKEQMGVRLNDLLKRADITADVAMRPGDIVIIPQSYF
jgi:polysaccharide biosynthesis/export protein